MTNSPNNPLERPPTIGPITRRAPRPAPCWRQALVVLGVGLACVFALDFEWHRQQADLARGRAHLVASDTAIELARRVTQAEAMLGALAAAAQERGGAEAHGVARALVRQAPHWLRGLGVYDVDAAEQTHVVVSRDGEAELLLDHGRLAELIDEISRRPRDTLRIHPASKQHAIAIHPIVQLGSLRAVAILVVAVEPMLAAAGHAAYRIRDGAGDAVATSEAQIVGRQMGPFARTIRPGQNPWIVEVNAADDTDERLRLGTFWAGVVLTLLVALWVCRITGRRREAQASARLYRNLFEVASDLVLVLDDDLRIRRANERAELLLGVGCEHRYGAPFLDTLATESREEAHAAIVRALNGATTEFVAPLHVSDGIRYRFRVVPVLINDAVFGLQVLAEDVTEKQALEREVRARKEELERLNSELYRASITDALTGVYNRRFLGERAEEEVSRALRYGRQLTCLFVDIDFFKRINDNYGHNVGDDVLQSFASLLTRHLRRTDIVGRYGGEEFVVLLTDTDAANAQLTADKLLRLIRGFRFPGLPGGVRVTASAGAASVVRGQIETVDALFIAADRALYEAKHAGRDRLVVHGALAA